MTSARKKPAAKAGVAPAVGGTELAVAAAPQAASVSSALLPELRQLIEASRRAAAVAVNMAQTQLYWRVGQRIRAEVLGEQRARYGEEIVATLWRQLSWSHFRELLRLKRPLQREFYAEMCRIEGWSVRKKQEQIELLELDKAGIDVAEYLTVLPPREVFQQKIQAAVAQARLLLARREEQSTS